METHSSILAWRIPCTEDPGILQSMRPQRVGQDLVTFTNTHTQTFSIFQGFPVVSVVKNLRANADTLVQSLSQENSPKNEIVTDSSILAWEIPWTEESGGLQSMGS